MSCCLVSVSWQIDYFKMGQREVLRLYALLLCLLGFGSVPSVSSVTLRVRVWSTGGRPSCLPSRLRVPHSRMRSGHAVLSLACSAVPCQSPWLTCIRFRAVRLLRGEQVARVPGAGLVGFTPEVALGLLPGLPVCPVR